MDKDYVDIEAYVQRARKLRSEAVGEIFSAGLQGLKQLFTSLKPRRMPRDAVVANPSAFMDIRYLR
jgi:hypothetical protein